MNPLFPANDQAVYKDAIFFSGHKFVGGIQTPGLTNNLNTYVPIWLFNKEIYGTCRYTGGEKEIVQKQNTKR